MRTPLFLVLLLSSAVHAQAVRPAPQPVPLIQQQPPSYPGATYTPPGAGASHGGLPGTQKPLAPPSPNKRLLPPTKEAGLWAADGAPVASDGSIFGVTLPLPEHPPVGAKEIANICAMDMATLMRPTRSERILAAPEPARACMAAQAYLACVLKQGAETERPRGGLPPLWTPRAVRLMIQPIAERMAKTLCADVKTDGDDAAAFRRLLEKYTWGPKDLTME